MNQDQVVEHALNNIKKASVKQQKKNEKEIKTMLGDNVNVTSTDVNAVEVTKKDDCPSTEADMKKLLTKKETIAAKKKTAAKTTHKISTVKNGNHIARRKPLGDDETEKKRSMWRLQYEKHKSKYLTVWSTSWRKSHPKEYAAYLKQQQKKKAQKSKKQSTE